MGLRALDAIFSILFSDRNHIPTIQPVFVDDLVKSGGHTAGEYGAISCIVMFDDELCRLTHIQGRGPWHVEL